MNILLVSECGKQALTETRRVLDQFAERRGSRTWQTAITEQGLLTLRKMLNKTARRNTAVACHVIRPGRRTELLWLVGNAAKFNPQGAVPTNSTSRNILRAGDEDLWRTGEDIALLAGIAGLFHDLGKANALFQDKLDGKGKSFEAYRHEWVSLRLFQAFVGGMSDREWLEQLRSPKEIDEKELLLRLAKDGLVKGPECRSPFEPWPPLARIIGWLILSHHRLPQWPQAKDAGDAPRLNGIESWLFTQLQPAWDSPQCLNPWKEKEKEANWKLPKGLPLKSDPWQRTAASYAQRALQRPDLFSGKKDWLADVFSMHVARLALMLGDHIWSAHPPAAVWRDKKCSKLTANTDRITRKPKQQLDEHLVGVAHHAVLLARRLPQLRRHLPALARHKGFRQRSGGSDGGRFAWQDKAFDLACAVRTRSERQGFFGINMASTGCGKTFANGRIMYGLADERRGCRFSVALGLRTLTLQTGDALRQRLHLQEDELAVLIGSQAVRQLHELRQEEQSGSSGSESGEDLLGADQHVLYDGNLAGSRIGLWLERSPKLLQLVSAPILVSTIDHLMPATEGARGGKQIAPMLRLLTSDLILDEPDDFDLADTHALCRLVHWAGLLGSRVLISSATLPPALIRALFAAYLAGRTGFQQTCGEQPDRPPAVCCAWFDEQKAAQSDHTDEQSFAEAHGQFARSRAKRLHKAPALRLAELLPVSQEKLAPTAAVRTMAYATHEAVFRLHAEHGQEGTGRDAGRKISVGLVRMANIKPLAAVAKELLTMPPPAGYHLHYCVYHSQHPLAVRSAMERMLDSVLSRKEPQKIWQHPDIRAALDNFSEKQHIFVVLASPVAEVGRDHDYDWAIAEPSSMRSLIQLAGRIRRHRQGVPPSSPNLLVFSRNYKAMTDYRAKSGTHIAFCKPGFESDQQDFLLKSHDLHDLLDFSGQLEQVSSIPRIVAREPLDPKGNLADLEHAHLEAELFGEGVKEEYAALWWKKQATWCYELQRRKPFRKSEVDMEYVLYAEEEDDVLEFNRVNEQDNSLIPCERDRFERVSLEYAEGVSIWGNNDPAAELNQLAAQLDMELKEACRKFGVMRLRQLNEQEQWLYDPAVGAHQRIE
jgi:CRISPR-associated endonuclease/helicase Cas3